MVIKTQETADKVIRSNFVYDFVSFKLSRRSQNCAQFSLFIIIDRKGKINQFLHLPGYPTSHFQNFFAVIPCRCFFKGELYFVKINFARVIVFLKENPKLSCSTTREQIMKYQMNCRSQYTNRQRRPIVDSLKS